MLKDSNPPRQGAVAHGGVITAFYWRTAAMILFGTGKTTDDATQRGDYGCVQPLPADEQWITSCRADCRRTGYKVAPIRTDSFAVRVPV